MTVPPLPDIGCVRCRLVYSGDRANSMGNRFFLSYGGSAPTGANCTTLASDIASAWNSDMAGLYPSFNALSHVDVLDIGSHMGASGVWDGTHDGTRSGSAVPVQCALGIEFSIAERYRGGKPRMYLPAGTETDRVSPEAWDGSLTGDADTQLPIFFAALEALSIGAMGTLTHVILSYYHGFTNITNSSGRTRAVPTYRPTALHFDVTGYTAKSQISSQRRRRSSTTP